MNKCEHRYKYADGSCINCMILQKQLNDPEFIKKRKLSANIPSKFFGVSFDTFEDTKEKELAEFAKEIKEYYLKKNILMTGTTGTGKTHLAISALIGAIKIGYSGYYAKFYDLPRMQIRDYLEFEKIRKVDFLIIDEFGVTASDYKSELLLQIIDRRYDTEQLTIIISNKNPEEVKSLMTDATYSRIKENCEVYDFNFEDFRLKKGGRNNT